MSVVADMVTPKTRTPEIAPVMGKSQEQLILRHLREAGSITQIEAAGLYKVRSLTRRIRTLRERGYKIHSERRTDPMGQRYVRYHLFESFQRG